jgi:hypothetical protein
MKINYNSNMLPLDQVMSLPGIYADLEATSKQNDHVFINKILLYSYILL